MRIPRFALKTVIVVRTAIAVPIMAFLGLAGFAQTQPAPILTTSASGHVLAANGHAIYHARVEFMDSSTWISSILTDTKGKFELEGLPLAEYRVTVSALGYERLETTVKVVLYTDRSVAPLLFQLQLRPAAQAPVPINDGAVSVQELRMSGKADSAFEKGVQRLQKGDLKGSLSYFQRALAKDPGYYRAYHDLGLAYLQMGDTARAEEGFQKAIDLTNGGYAPSEFAMAIILCQRQQFQEAERLIQNGLAMDPGSALGEYFLALVQLATNRLAEAEKSAREALWRNANQAEAHILLAKILEVRHNPRAVMVEVSGYLKLEPHGPLESEATELRLRAQQELAMSPQPTPEAR